MAELSAETLVEFQTGLSKLSNFLQNILPKESLSHEVDTHRKECITLVEGMNNSLNNMKNNNLRVRDDSLLNTGLSLSSQSLNETSALNGEEGITRSGSLPDMSSYGESENSDSWKASRIKGSYLDHEELNLNDLRELVIYHPIEEEDDESDDDDDVQSNLNLNASGELNLSNRSPVNKRKSRKRDSAALFDISLEDLTEPDFAGILKEKHSEKLWWCVLLDQHLCIFPSQDPDEVAYDVLIMPCCQISLDDRLMRTPVFRLTQVGMSPWVFVASDNDELKEWMKVLTIAASAGKHSSTPAANSEEKQFSVSQQAPAMQSIIEEEEEPVDEDEQSPPSSLISEVKPDPSQLHKNSSGLNESEENPPISYVNADPLQNGPEKKEFPALPKIPDEVDGEQFGEDIYEAVANLKAGGEEFQDDGFATDEFDSGSSDEGGVSQSPQSQPVQQKGKKRKQFFHWLKKKARKDKLFSSPKDGVALAGYAHKSNDSTKRWFLIREQKLQCYKTIKDDDPEIMVDLDGCEIKAGEEERNKLAIQVVRDGATQFTLVAKSAKDWERWKKAFLIESGFIKLAVSPTDTSSGVFDQEDEDDYVTPIVSPGLEKSPPATIKSNVKVILENNNQSMDTGDDDLYMEVVPTNAAAEEFKKVSPSSSQLELGPLPPLPPVPPDLPPPRSPEDTKGGGDSESGDNSGEYEDEIYEEVSSTVAHADKVIKWDGVTHGTSAGVQNKHVDKASKGPMPAGLSDGTIEDSAITASSFLDSSSKPCAGRLNSSDGSWCAKTNDKQQYLQIDLGVVTKVCGVASQGRPGFIDQGGWFVKTYTLAYSKDGENWANYKEFGIAKVFQGNNDPDTVVTNMLKMAVNAHYVRIKPQSWHNHIALRAEVYKGEASSKLTAGIHKLADTLSKTGKKKSFDRQNTPTSPSEYHDEEDSKADYVDRRSSTEDLLNGDDEKNEDEHGDAVHNEGATDEEQPEDYLQLVREPSIAEKEVELKVQQKIEALRKGGEGSQTIGKHEVSQSILAKKSLYENSQQSAPNTEQKKNVVTKVKKETVVTTKKIIIEKKDAEERERKDSASSQDADKEREMLDKTEQAFQTYAKQLKKEGGQSVKEKRPSLVALSRMNFEDPRTITKTENTSYPAKMESLLKEKEELMKKMENLKKRIKVAKDRKIFFSLSTTRSKATADAEEEFHESQYDLAKTKKRLMEIENETKNLKVMELRYQKTPEKSPNPNKPFLRKNSRECKLGSAEIQTQEVVSSVAPSESEKEVTQKGSVLSQIKAFEQMKKTSEK